MVVKIGCVKMNKTVSKVECRRRSCIFTSTWSCTKIFGT